MLTGIIALPFYITEMGAEAYGLVGFFTMLQAWFNLLDLGLTPTISRETARFRAGTHSPLTFSRLYRALNLLFFMIAIIGGGILLLASDNIAENWLKAESLSISEISFALKVMAISVALRWMTGLYRGMVTGSEQLVWLSGFNVLIAFLRFIVVFLIMRIYGATPAVFFSYQLLIAILEFIGLWHKSKTLQPELSSEERSIVGWSIKPIKPFLKFSLSIALTSGIWVLVTQVDKLLMSKLLSLEDYGYFTLAVLVATGIMMVSGPISNAILPRMSKLEAENKRDEMIRVYRDSTQIVTVIAGTAAIMLVMFAEPILYVWTGDKNIVEVATPILQLYAFGYGLLAVAAFPYYLQYAMGLLKLHIIGSLLFVAALLPGLWWATERFGMIGAGYAWVLVNLFYFLIWTFVVHKMYAKEIHFQWLMKDIFAIIALPIVVAGFLMLFFVETNRITMTIELLIIGLILLAFAAISSKKIRESIFRKIKQEGYDRS